jgi:hypothetical protein
MLILEFHSVLIMCVFRGWKILLPAAAEKYWPATNSPLSIQQLAFGILALWLRTQYWVASIWFVSLSVAWLQFTKCGFMCCKHTSVQNNASELFCLVCHHLWTWHTRIHGYLKQEKLILGAKQEWEPRESTSKTNSPFSDSQHIFYGY